MTTDEPTPDAPPRKPRKLQRVIDSYNGIPCAYVRPADAPNRPGEVCGVIHQCCTAHVSTGSRDGPVNPKYGDPCRKLACVGQLVCWKHGGAAPGALAKAADRVAAEKAEQAVTKRLGGRGRPVTNPNDELSRLAGEMIAWKDAALELVAELDGGPVGVTDDGDLVPGILAVGASGLDVHPVVKLAERANLAAKGILAEMVKLGFVERQTTLEEQQASMLHAALTAALQAQGIDPALVLPRFAAELRALETGALPTTATERP